MVLLFALTVVQRGIGFLRGVLFCRWLDADQLGQWDLAYGILMPAVPAIVLGLPGSLGRYVDHYHRQGQLRTFLRRIALATLALGVAGVTVIGLARTTIARAVFAAYTAPAAAPAPAAAFGSSSSADDDDVVATLQASQDALLQTIQAAISDLAPKPTEPLSWSDARKQRRRPPCKPGTRPGPPTWRGWRACACRAA